MDINMLIEEIAREVVRQGAMGSMPQGSGSGLAHPEMAKYFDHTVLHANTKTEKVVKFCEEAAKYHFAAVCINPTHISLAAQKLKGTGVKVATVIGFPLGANTPEVKAFEVRDAIARGVDEVDMVINIGAAKDGNWELVREDIKAVVDAARSSSRYIGVKVIIETCLLTDEEKIKACEISRDCGADFVKTSTGFSTGGATAEDVALMKRTVGPNVQVKASTGIKTLEDVQKLVAAGATRMGSSAGVKVVTGSDHCNNCSTCTKCKDNY